MAKIVFRSRESCCIRGQIGVKKRYANHEVITRGLCRCLLRQPYFRSGGRYSRPGRRPRGFGTKIDRSGQAGDRAGQDHKQRNQSGDPASRGGGDYQVRRAPRKTGGDPETCCACAAGRTGGARGGRCGTRCSPSGQYARRGRTSRGGTGRSCSGRSNRGPAGSNGSAQCCTSRDGSRSDCGRDRAGHAPAKRNQDGRNNRDA